MNAARPEHSHVVVIGSGMAGIGAATVLEANDVRVTVLERSPEPGGRVKTVRIDGTPVDLGAQFLAAFYPTTLAAARTGGLDADLVPRPQRTAVVSRGALWNVTSLPDLLRDGLLSLPAKLRLPGLALPLAVAWHRLHTNDLSKAWPFDYFSARDLVNVSSGSEVARNFVEPIVRGLLYWDLSTTSQSVLLVMLKEAVHRSDAFRVEGGIDRLVRAVARNLDIRTGSAVTTVRQHDSGSCIVQVRDSNGVHDLVADGVVCATTATAARQIIADPPAATAGFLESVTYSRTLVVTYRVAEGKPLPSSSLVFPADKTPLLASVNPPWHVGDTDVARYMKVFLSDAGYEDVKGLDDDAIATTALAAVRECGVEVEWTTGAVPVHVWRWEEALPRFPVGYLRTDALRRPGWLDFGQVVFAGDYLHAPHLEGAFVSGHDAARRLLPKL